MWLHSLHAGRSPRELPGWSRVSERGDGRRTDARGSRSREAGTIRATSTRFRSPTQPAECDAVSATITMDQDPRENDDSHKEDDNDHEEDDDEEEHEEEHFTKLIKYKSRNAVEASLIAALGNFNACPLGFCVHGVLTDMPLPGLCLGATDLHLSMPVTADVLPKILATGLLEDAPFGKGENTVLDPKVRSTLQASPSKCFFSNPAWDPFVQSIAQRCGKEMGVPNRVHASLHKLLVYRPGDHFDQHRDAVHEPRMFGTLILQLPSVYSGGELIVEHAGSKVKVDDAATAAFQVSYAAFFADCQHKVLPVESGVRVVLAFNLIHEASQDKNPAPPSPSEHEQQKRFEDQLDDAVQIWYANALTMDLTVKNSNHGSKPNAKRSKVQDKPNVLLAMVCEHLYPASLHSEYETFAHDQRQWPQLSSLKGGDLARAQALLGSFERCMLDMGMGIAKLDLLVGSGPTEEQQFEFSHTAEICEAGLGSRAATRPLKLKINPYALFTTGKDLSKAANEHCFSQPFAEHIGNESLASQDAYSFIAVYFYPQARCVELLLRDSVFSRAHALADCFDDPRLESHEAKTLLWLSEKIDTTYNCDFDEDGAVSTKLVSMWLDKIDIAALVDAHPAMLSVLNSVTKYPPGPRAEQLQRMLVERWTSPWTMTTLRACWTVSDFAMFSETVKAKKKWCSYEFAEFFNGLLKEHNSDSKERALVDATLEQLFSTNKVVETRAFSLCLAALISRSSLDDALYAQAMYSLTRLPSVDDHHSEETEILKHLVSWTLENDKDGNDKWKTKLWTYPAVVALAGAWATEEGTLLETEYYEVDLSKYRHYAFPGSYWDSTPPPPSDVDGSKRAGQFEVPGGKEPAWIKGLNVEMASYRVEGNMLFIDKVPTFVKKMLSSKTEFFHQVQKMNQWHTRSGQIL